MKNKKIDCKKCKNCMIYRDTVPYYEEDKILCTLSPKVACWEIIKCSHFEGDKNV